MDESAIKGMELNDSDADNRKSRSVTMIVSGYDKSLHEDDIKSLLSKHFSSCGEITKVYIPADVESNIHNKYAFVDITGEDAEEKALQLNGSDMGGRNLLVKIVPAPTRVVEIAVRWAELNEKEGYDTWLPEDNVKSALKIHFSSCGEISCVSISRDKNGGLYKRAYIYIRGDDVAEKAWALSGRDMGGWKANVVHCTGPKEIKFDRLHVGRKKAKSMFIHSCYNRSSC